MFHRIFVGLDADGRWMYPNDELSKYKVSLNVPN